MTLPGMSGIVAGVVEEDEGYSATMTVGGSTVVIGYDPKGGGDISSTAVGFGNSEALYGTFGALDVANYQGYPIKAIYQADGSGITYLELTGDAHLLTPTLKVNTVDQNLGAGSFSAGVTTFGGTTTDPFTGHATRTIAITP